MKFTGSAFIALWSIYLRSASATEPCTISFPALHGSKRRSRLMPSVFSAQCQRARPPKTGDVRSLCFLQLRVTGEPSARAHTKM